MPTQLQDQYQPMFSWRLFPLLLLCHRVLSIHYYVARVLCPFRTGRPIPGATSGAWYLHLPTDPSRLTEVPLDSCSHRPPR
jgi:hypothetical protein